MISNLTGILNDLTPSQIVLEVNGVGYEIEMPISHIGQLPNINQQVKIFTHQVVREDAHLLFGFVDKSERDCFRQLIKVSGIGPKIALALLSTLKSAELAIAIETVDIDRLCLTPGIGKKMAERMMLELKGKLLSVNSSVNLTSNSSSDLTAKLHRYDLITALENLGYNRRQIQIVIDQLPDSMDISQAIKAALKLLSNN